MNAYTMPIGTEFTLNIGTEFKINKRRWRLISRMSEHPYLMTFKEVTIGASTPDRIMNPSEIDALIRVGVQFSSVD